MNVLIDTCVVIDYLQERAHFVDAAEEIFSLAINKQIRGIITAKSATDIYYLSHKFTHSNAECRKILSNLFQLVDLIDTTKEDVYCALNSNMSDYEDAVMVEAAKRADVSCIITRNTTDYAESSVPAYTPDEFLNMMNN